MNRPRDSYRARVIEACKDMPQKTLTPPEWTNMTSRVRESAWGKKHIIKFGVAGLYSVCQAGHDPPLHRPTDLSFCHALAHAMTPDDVALHGPEFCRNFIEATRKWCGDVSGVPKHVILRKKLIQHKAKLRAWSPEAKERAKQRYAERSFDGAKEELRAMLAELEDADEATI